VDKNVRYNIGFDDKETYDKYKNKYKKRITNGYKMKEVIKKY
jgi:hypothetical protein